MEIFEYTLAQGRKMECPFDRAYSDATDICYHGTSNLVKAKIESDGFFGTIILIHDLKY